MTIEPWIYWLNIGMSVALIGFLFRQMSEQNKLREKLIESTDETCRWIDKSTEGIHREHELYKELIKTGQARDAVLRLNAKQFKELQNYKTTMQEIAAGKHLYVRSKKYGSPESKVLTAQELAQNALDNGGKVQFDWEVLG